MIFSRNNDWRRQSGNLLTLARIAVTPLYVACVVAEDARLGWVAGCLFAFAAASDVWDGRLARRYGEASTLGRFLDHFADIGFLLAGYAGFVVRGDVPWWVPASIGAAFAFYVVDSLWRSAQAQPNLIGSRIGHFGGVANYVLLGVLTFDAAAGLRWLPGAFLCGWFLLVPVYCAAAVATRWLGSSQRTQP